MAGFYGGSPLEYAGIDEQGSDAVPATTGEVLGGQFGSALAGNLTPRLFRATERGAAEADSLAEPRPRMFRSVDQGMAEPAEPAVDPATLNQQYGIPGHLSFDRPLPESSARDLHEHKRAELVRQNVIARREGGVATGAVARTGTGLIAGLLDPINLAVGLVPIVGEARVATILGRGAAGAMGAGELAGVRAAAGAASGGAAMTALQPLEFALSRSEHEDFTMADALRNIAFGAVLGGGLHVVGGAIVDRVTGRYANPITQRVEEQTPQVRQEVLQGALAQHIADEPVNVAPALDLFDALRAEQLGARQRQGPSAAENPAAAAPTSELAGFTTAKGSTYALHDDGTTTRDKSFHPEHGAADQGPQPRSEATFYVIAADAQKLGEIQSQGGPSRIIAPLGDGRWGVKYLDGKDAGKFEARTVVTGQTVPQQGLAPVEIFAGGKRVHFGNEIIAVERAPASEPAAVPVGEPAPVAAPEVPATGQPVASAPAGQTARLVGEPVAAIPPHRVATATGESIDVAPIIVEARDLKTSADPGYDPALQPRDRDRASAGQQVREMAARLDPERLGFSSEADRGAPIVGADGMVESGNGRVMAIRQAYEDNRHAQGASPGSRYREWLTSQGVDVARYDEPVLVRQRTTDMTPQERQAFAIAANRPATLALSASERALADSRAITPDMLELIRNPDDLGAVANRDFVRSFVDKLPQAEQGMIATAEGGLSAEGLARVRNAVLARAYGDAALLARIAEATQDEIRSISNALTAAAPLWAKLRADIEAGRVLPHVDLTPALLDAVARTADLRAKGVRLDRYFAQTEMFDRPPKVVEDWMRMFYNEAGSRAAGTAHIAEGLKSYASEARKANAERGLDLGIAPASASDIQRLAIERSRGDAGGSGILFPGGPSNGPGDAAGRGEVRRPGADEPRPGTGAGGDGSTRPGEGASRLASPDELRRRQAQAIGEMAQRPTVADETTIAANAPTPAGEMTLPAIERELAELEARSGIAQPVEPGAAGAATGVAGEAPGTFRTTVEVNGERTVIEGPTAALERPAELLAADAEVETAQARAAAYERAAKCIIEGA